MNAKEFLGALTVLETEKGISKDYLIEAVENALQLAYKKNFSIFDNARVEIDRNTGEVHVFNQRTVVDVVGEDDDNIEENEISVKEAKEINKQYVVGDTVEFEVTPRDFGRIAAQTAKQVIMQKIREAEREIVFEEFKDKQEDIVIGTVLRGDERNTYISLGKSEAILPYKDQIPGERFLPEERVRIYINKFDREAKGAAIRVTRIHPGLLKRLMELEIPEIYDGTIEIKSISREPGERAKVAVYSHEATVDPVGSCIGQNGSRIQPIVEELRGERIDIIEWSSDPEKFIADSLAPARITAVIFDEADEEKAAMVIVPDDQLSLAIGRKGQNVRLAARLTGWNIDIKSESEAEELAIM